ncbi:MAG: class I SAM-dependent methyltransferase [Bdellovibrionota bacterium]
MSKPIYTRIQDCRICEGKDLTSVLDLGMQALTGVFPKTKETDVPQGPLELLKCGSCDLVQLAHNYDLSKLYGDHYGYRSGLNQSMVRHLKSKVERILSMVDLSPKDLVIDIGANDSTLLQNYPSSGPTLIGVDPSGPKFKKYYPSHIDLIPDFFSKATVSRKLGIRKVKIITSIAMFYDLERPQTFVREIFECLADDGVWVFEQSYMPFMLDTVSYDTVCHEHLEYYSLHQIKYMADRNGFKIVDLEFNDINGGSFSIMMSKKSAKYPEITAKINEVLAQEKERGLNSLRPFDEFRKNTEEHRKTIRAFFDQAKRDGKTVFGYGASTKGNVLLQWCHVTSEDMPFIAEVNEDKFGASTPGTKIPIISEIEARAKKPDYLFVLPWHFKAGILPREQAYLKAGGRLVFPLPKFTVIDSSG